MKWYDLEIIMGIIVLLIIIIGALWIVWSTQEITAMMYS